MKKRSLVSNARLVAKWEARLASEGMHKEPVHDRKQSFDEPYDILSDTTGIVDSPAFQRWTAMTHAVTALPETYPYRAFLMRYSETGYLTTTCREFKITRQTGRTVLLRFAKHLKDSK